MGGSSHHEVRQGNEAQIAEALSDFNKWVTGERVGREPSTRECLEHYINNGGAEAFRQRCNAEQPPVTGEECQG